MSWRLNDYYNPGLTVAGGLHLEMMTHPISRITTWCCCLYPKCLSPGIQPQQQDGPAPSTVQEFEHAAGPACRFHRPAASEYRWAHVDLAGFRFVITHRWDYFKDDSPFSSTGVVAAGNGTCQVVLNQLQCLLPDSRRESGLVRKPFPRANKFGIDARMTYVSETATSPTTSSAVAQPVGRRGDPADCGGGQRPAAMMAGDFNLSFFPTENLSVVNTTAVPSTASTEAPSTRRSTPAPT